MSEIYSLDLQEELLSHLAIPDSWLVIQGEEFSADLIEDDFVAIVFEWQKQYIRREGKPAPVSVLEHEFADDGLQLSTPETSIGDLLDRLREQYAKNQQRQVIEDLGDTYLNKPRELGQMMIQRGRELNDLLQSRGEVFGTGDFERAKYRYDKKVEAGPGASWGFKEVNDYFFGMRGVGFILGTPKSMKSWIICNAVVDNIRQGRCTHLKSLELPAEETDMRIRCLCADVPFWHYIYNQMTRYDWQRIQEQSEILDGSGIYKVVKPPRGKRGIDEMVYTARDAGADVVFVDQLQYVENTKGESIGSLNQTGEYWNVLDRARDLSDVGPICFAHQFNRQAMFADALPPIEYAKGSSAIEEVATIALGLWANKDMRQSNILGLGTLVTRNSGLPAWHLAVDLADGCSFSVIDRLEDEEV